MAEFAKEITQITIEEELKKSYLDYSMSVIVGRALPDVRDGLKPVHRRVLFAMRELGNDWNKPYKKSARIVGDVIGKYHPHGDTAVYDTIVRMAQDFSMRYILVDGQGNFGSVDGDSPAAMRYTEVRMSRLAHALLTDLEKETVDFIPNYDETEFIPFVLPTRIPNLLVNGSSGIAVGMATNIPPHNLNEVVDACIALINDSTLTIKQLMQYISGPDFPTSGIINGQAGIVEAYHTGRGRIYLRAKTKIEENEKSGKQAIIVTELPYQVNKARLLEKIAELIKTKKLDGITALRDESDKDGMRMFIELRRGERAEVVLNNLYAHTQMQSVFGINMVALDNGHQPRLFNLKQILEAFIIHRREVVIRRTLYDLRKARERGHILEGLGIALANIDEVIALVKGSSTPNDAKSKLLAQLWNPGTVVQMLEKAKSCECRPETLLPHYGLQEKGYRLSPVQAQAILDLRLHRLTGLEQDKLFEEYKKILDLIHDLIEILENKQRLMALIKEDLLEIKKQFGDKRKTQIISSKQDFTNEDLIAEEDVVVTLSREGYIKSQPLDLYQAQKRGGKGKIATGVKEEDFIEKLELANTHDTLLSFSNKGKVYWFKVYQLPQAARQARGRPIVNLLPLDKEERITAILPINEFSDNHFIVMATARGTIKKVSLSCFAKPRANGIIALDLIEDDQLIGAEITDGKNDIMLFADSGKAIRFNESKVRAMGRTARGVRGVRLQKEQKVVSMIIAKHDQGDILTATECGYGKRTKTDEYRISGRGGQGVISIQTNKRNGKVIAAVQVNQADEIMLITDGGILVRTRTNEVSLVGRNTQGVRLINLAKEEKLIGVERIPEIDEPLSEIDESVPEINKHEPEIDESVPEIDQD